jgi:predicted NUDIX family NTP pyrophosphohydrolase
MRHSAGILLHRRTGAGLEVFIAHMGGPFWARKDERAWSIPKGETDGETDLFAVAHREFAEEVGVPAPDAEYRELGTVRYSSGKAVTVFAAEAAGFEVDQVRSNTFELEWPPRSGRIRTFPEVDAVAWVPVDLARSRLVAGQVPAIDALEALGAPG